MLRPKKRDIQELNALIVLLDDCLAKTIHAQNGDKAGVSVVTHCCIVGDIARELLVRLPGWLRNDFFSRGSELIAAAHDIGKVSPTFQEKIHRDIGKKLGIIDPDLDKTIGYHFAVSQATIDSSLKYIPEILGRHHGFNPQSVNTADSEIYGGAAWQKQRIDLLNRLKKYLDTDWPAMSSALQADVLAGLTTVADWIASGSLFDEVTDSSWKNYVTEACDKAGFVAPKICKGLSFKDIFGFSPRDIQVRLCESIKMPGAYVLEAPMGLGKTEAALYASYKALEENRATGIYFALPTQLTSDKIYDRMNVFLAKILDESDSSPRSLLLHGSAWLRDTELGEEGAPGQSWFNSSKRGTLAPFAVGTIDQALMAVMNVKHGFVRTFGLMGKVVILDEVHSYDSYTGTILKELVDALRGLHCTVIILSATLTQKQKCGVLSISADRHCLPSYPLISAYPESGNFYENEAEKLENYQVNIRLTLNDTTAIDEAILRAEKGAQVLWIENTVAEAQTQYCRLAAIAQGLGIECGLLHSRFIKIHRQINEEKWVNIFGKNAAGLRRKKGRILVGTQVLEQSLDIDADFLVTRICPVDMIFQRIGRLWRHRENDSVRCGEARREAWVLAPALGEAIAKPDNLGKSAKVYSPYILCRTLEVLKRISSINLPDQIRQILEATYSERFEEGNMAKYKQETEKERNKLRSLALVGVSRGGKTLPESKASTRYSEVEAVDVLLIKKLNYTSEGSLLRLLDGSQLLLPTRTNVSERRQISIELFKNTVSVPEYLAPNTDKKQITWLKDYVYLGNDIYKYADAQEESPFRVAIVEDSDELGSIGNLKASVKYDLSYNAYLGYVVKKKNGGDNDSE